MTKLTCSIVPLRPCVNSVKTPVWSARTHAEVVVHLHANSTVGTLSPPFDGLCKAQIEATFPLAYRVSVDRLLRTLELFGKRLRDHLVLSQIYKWPLQALQNTARGQQDADRVASPQRPAGSHREPLL